jgi:type I restriction enzyme S subunit
MTNLNEKIFSNLMVHIPFLKEQEIIVQRVNDLFSFADQIEARYQNARNHVDHLAQSILAKAFRGELVPQDPNDPPASELLKHIQAEREKQPELRKAGKRGPTHQRRARPKA